MTIRFRFDVWSRPLAIVVTLIALVFVTACEVDTSTSAAATPTSTSPSILAKGPITLPMLLIREVPADIPDYDRDDWNHWIDVDRDCQNARHEVLIAESSIEVEFTNAGQCSVSTGRWLAVYTGNTVETASSLDIDHMVPLNNAHVSGAWGWDDQRREDYANDLSYANHLIAVTASANRSKGAKGPEEWRPPDNGYWCQYAVDWITIKAQWGLSANANEWAALDEMLNTCAVEVMIEGEPPVVQQTPTPTITSVITIASGAIVITEIMANPSVVSDANGEWVEIHNPSNGSEVDINGWTIKDQGSNSHVIDNGGPLIVPPGGFLILGRNADSATNGGIALGYEVSSSFTLANTDDEIELVAPDGTVVDAVIYDSSLVFDGSSASLTANAFDSQSNDSASNWCESGSVMTSGDRGTPGAPNDDCP